MNAALVHYKNLNNYYKANSNLNISPYSNVSIHVKPVSRFKDVSDIELPFMISGRLLTAQTYKTENHGSVVLSREALKESVDEWLDLPIYSSHAVFQKVMQNEDVSVDEVLGKITRVSWNEEDGGIDFFAEIYDKDIAVKMAAGLIRFISGGFARDIVSVDGMNHFMNIEPKEVSLVFDPRDKNAVFEPVS